MVARVGIKQARSARTRAKLAFSARELFAAEAYDAVSPRRVATLAGHSPSTIYNYWRDKAALWRDVMGCEPPVDSALARRASKLIVGHDKLMSDLGDLLEAIESGHPKAQLSARVRTMLQEQSDAVQSPVGGPTFATPIDADPEIEPTQMAVSIGAKLRAIRLERGLSQVELSKVLGVTIQQVSRYERAKSHIPAGSIVKLAGRLGCSVQELVEGTS